MPGILPMKVIKVGTSSQSRIAQACDRCRSKKIRCDGIRPCCSQCANVGFECRTSDKLSRRAFPRGYTESLEERVRQLELEVRELKDLLDEKDEKIDMLSKMHSNQRHASVSRNAASPLSGSASSPSPAPTTSSCENASQKSPATSTTSLAALSPSSAKGASKNTAEKKELSDAREDTFRVQASPLVLGVENSDSYFMGASSGRSFIDIFKRKMQKKGKMCADFHAEAFLHIQGCYPLAEKAPATSMSAPPRLFSDRCVNVYFQEWSPLFPILHRPAFLGTYDEFVSDADKVKSQHKIAQLYLVFAIAGLSTEQPDLEMVAACEQQWQQSLDAVLMDNTMITLQCLVLALLYCSMRADYKRLQYYKGIAIGLSHRLGLHQSQKRFSFGALTIETRKRVFWTLYTLDCFSAAVLGLPRQMKDDDIHTEYPADTDDEYITEKGFQPTLPGEPTRISSALALFHASRILAKVLDTNYPAAASHELSLQKMAALDAELTEWRDALPRHLTLTFRQEKPSTDVTGNRSPLLSLVYHYARTLVWRPAVGSTLGPKAAHAVMAISNSSKCIVQIIELLEERNMSFSMCVNKPDLLVVCGMALLYQSMDLNKDSKMLKDTERLVNSVLKMANRTKAPGCYNLTRVAALLVTVEDVPALPAAVPPAETSMAAPLRRASQSQASQKKPNPLSLSRHNSASMSETDLLVQQQRLRQMLNEAAGVDVGTRPRGRSSFDSPREPKQHSTPQPSATTGTTTQQRPAHATKSNLDYLNISAKSPRLASAPLPRILKSRYYSQSQKATSPSAVTPADWEALLSSMDGGQLNVYDAIYGGPNIGLPSGTDVKPQLARSQSGDTWSPKAWELGGLTLADIVRTGSNSDLNVPAPAQSVLSFSDESMSSVGGDDLTASDLAGLGLSGLDLGNAPYRNTGTMLNPVCGTGPESFAADNLEKYSL